MAIQYAGGTYDDRSVVTGATPAADMVALIAASCTASGWTVTGGNQYNAYGHLSTGSNPANNNTVTVNGRVYTWKTTLTGAADEIAIGATATISVENFKAAINAEAGAGTKYGTGTTVNADCECLGLFLVNGITNPPVAFLHSKGATGLTLAETSNLELLSGTFAGVARKLVSAETPAFQKVTCLLGGGNTTTLLGGILRRDGSTGTGKNASINITTGDTYRVLSHRYGWHGFETGVYNANHGHFAQVPYIPTFQAPKKITDATNASPIVITTSAAHGYQTGDSVLIRYVEGNTAANGIFSITVLTTTTFSLNSSTGSGAFSGSLGLVANQTPPRQEMLECVLGSIDATTSAAWTTSSLNYGNCASGGAKTIIDGTAYHNSGTPNWLFPKPSDTGNGKFVWVSGAGVAIEPQIIFAATLYGSIRCGGQLYNAYWSSENTLGGSTNSADSHTWYGIWNNDTNGQLFLLTS